MYSRYANVHAHICKLTMSITLFDLIFKLKVVCDCDLEHVVTIENMALESYLILLVLY